MDSVWCHRTEPLLLNGSTVRASLPTAQIQGHLPGGQVQAWLGQGRECGVMVWRSCRKKTQDAPGTAARNFGFCFQASALRKAAQRRCRTAS